MDLSERKRKILKAIIENYIETAEPVGSKYLAAETGGALSSATIRNEMSELEEMGFIEKPHTSAGRVPSPLGYRLYVDELMNHYRTTAREIETMRRALEEKIRELDRTMAEASAILSELTGQPTVSLSAKHSEAKVKRVELIPIDGSDYALVAVTVPPAVNNRVIRLEQPLAEEEGMAFCRAVNLMLQKEGGSRRIGELARAVPPGSPLAELIAQAADFIEQVELRRDTSDMVVQGASRLLDNPEYYDAKKAQQLLEFLSDKEKVFALARDPRPQMIHIRIGPENGEGAMQDASFVFTTYDLGEDTSGILGVIGPTRMDYSKIASRLVLLSRGLRGLMPIRFPEEEDGGAQ